MIKQIQMLQKDESVNSRLEYTFVWKYQVSALLMQSWCVRHLRGPWLWKHICVNVHHQISSCCILHYKTHMLLGLETCEKINQEWVTNAVHGFKYPLLTHQAGKIKTVVIDKTCAQTITQNREWENVPFDLITSHDISLFKGFDGKHFTCDTVFRK